MRTDGTELYYEANREDVRKLRLVIRIEFDASNHVYLTSHDDIGGIFGGIVIYGVLQNTSSTSQKLNPVEGRSEIGSINFHVVDYDGLVTAQFRAQNNAGRGLRDKVVRLYSGFEGLDFADFRLEQTQIIAQSVTYDDGLYKVQCSDVQRFMRKDIFDLAKTRLAASIDDNDDVIPVYDTSDFEPCTHDAGYGDAPNQTVYYLKIKYDDGFEIIRATGKTGTTFTGCTRNVLGTKAVAHAIEGTPTPDNGPEVEEVVYLEGPAPKIAYALLTGVLLNQTGASFPSRWHCDVPTQYVDQSAFLKFRDLYKPGGPSGNDDTHTGTLLDGLKVRFEALTKTDGKAFIEKEIMLMMAAFMPISGGGKLGMKKMSAVTRDAAFVDILDADVIADVGEITYSLSDLHNEFDIKYAWRSYPEKTDYFRRQILTDAVSQASHGKGSPIAISFKGLQPSVHTETALNSAFDGLRDRYAAPPIKCKLKLLPSKNSLEVGDMVFVNLQHVRDYTGPDKLQRVMEVQGITVDQDSGEVAVELFGSTALPSVLAHTRNAQELPDGWYASAGTVLPNVSAGVLTANATITGGDDVTATASIFYVNGSLTIPAGRTLTIGKNVWLRVRGFLQNDGTINGVGGGQNAGQPGYIGPTESGGGINGDYDNNRGRPDDITNKSFRGTIIDGITHSADRLTGVSNDGGVFRGFPKDLRGTGGAAGKACTNEVSGANGGATSSGGAGLLITSRGMSVGASGKIDLSGAPGGAGTLGTLRGDTDYRYQGGSGGGGAPGTLYVFIDGKLSTAPILSGYVVGKYGALTYDPTYEPEDRERKYRKGDYFHDDPRAFKVYSFYKGKGSDDISGSIFRIQYVPESLTPYQTYRLNRQELAIEAATAAAAAAQADADQSLALLSDIASDGKLTAADKIKAKREYGEITQEQVGIDSEATRYLVTTEKTAYDNAVTTLKNYLRTTVVVLDSSFVWNNITGTTDIARATWDSNWKAVYNARQVLLNKIVESAKAGIDAAQTSATNAFNAANAAQADATQSLALLGEIAADGKLTAGEKIEARREYGEVTQEQAGIDFEAARYGITTAKSNYDNAITALKLYLRTTLNLLDASYVWTSITGTTNIVRTTWDANWQAVFAARQTLLNKIAEMAARQAELIAEGFYDDFDNAESVNLWAANNYSGTGEVTRVAVSDASGGYVMQIGNNSGNDQGWLIHPKMIAYDPTKLYEMSVRIRQVAGSGTTYLGFGGVAADGVTWVNSGGDNTISGQHYFWSGVVPSTSSWSTIRMYFKGNDGYAGGSINPGVPAKAHPNVRYMRPLVLCNYSSVAGIAQVDWVRIKEVQVDALGRPLIAFSGDQNATFGADLSSNVSNRSTAYLWRGVDVLSDVVQRINGGGRAYDTRFFRASQAWQNTVTKSNYTTLTTANSAGNCSISITAFTAQFDYGSYSYPSGYISGLTANTTYFVYMVDPNGDGTGVTYAATTNFSATSAAPDRGYVGWIKTPATSGGGGGGGDECVAVDMFVSGQMRAGEAVIGDDLIVLYDNGKAYGKYPVISNRISPQECVRIVTRSGCAVVCSISTPITLRDGTTVPAQISKGHNVAVLDRGIFRWEIIEQVDYVGIRDVAHLGANDGTYAAGEIADRYVFTHNLRDKPPY